MIGDRVLSIMLAVTLIAAAVLGLYAGYRNYRYMTVTQVGVYDHYMGEKCKSSPTGITSINRCTPEIKYPILITKYWSDSEDSVDIIKNVHKDVWTELKNSKGFIPTNPEM